MAPDVNGLVGAIDLGTVVGAIVAVAVLKWGPQLVRYAVRVVSRMFPESEYSDDGFTSDRD